jgi:phosphoglycolate phosphatase
MKKFNTVIFDMDGTLLNTLDDLTISVNYIMKKKGFPPRSIEEVKDMVGNGVSRLLQSALPDAKKTPDFEQLLNEYITHYKANMYNHTAPYPGIMELLSTLSSQGCKLAVVSNKMDKAVRELNQKYFQDYIKIAIGESAGIQRKPAPDTVFEAIRELGASTEQAVYVGDSEVDIQTAANAGLTSIGVTWGFRDKPVLQEAGADYIIDSPEDLLCIL